MKIKKLKDNRKVISSSLSLKKEIIDRTTGEVTSKEETRIFKTTSKDEFIKLFVLNLDFIATQLENSEKTILMLILKNLDWKNLIHITSELKKELAIKSGMHIKTIYRVLKQLEEKRVISKISDDTHKKEFEIVGDKYYMLNYNIAGKGSANDLSKIIRVTEGMFD